jgi:hypothetical protein
MSPERAGVKRASFVSVGIEAMRVEQNDIGAGLNQP